jgi:signal transduction histidine kinase/ActR/RegA family two-component response regulator
VDLACVIATLAVGGCALIGQAPPGGPLAWALAGGALATLVGRRLGPAAGSCAAPGPAFDAETSKGLPAHPRDRAPLDEDSGQSHKMEAVGRLAGGVAHDFNNILTVINGCSDILLDTLPAGDSGRELIGEIKKAGERGVALTRQLLAFSRKQMTQPQVVDLCKLVRDLEGMLRRLVREDVVVVLNLHPAPLPVFVDPGQIEQVLMNLVINARDAMPAGGTITITTDCVEQVYSATKSGKLPPGPHVLLKVADTGCGMDAETKARIFEPFFTTKERGKGTGLGLATAYGVVQQSGGVIEVTSAPGRGTAFRIRLPLAPDAADSGVSPAARPDSVKGGAETVLLVEDEDGVRALVRRTLQSLGYNVLEARNGMEALVRSRKHRGTIELLLTDVVMPHLGGAELMPILKRRHPRLRVIFMSGYAESVVVSQGIALGEARYLDKPFTADQLSRLVREALDEPAR